MTQAHPITPPPELVDQWVEQVPKSLRGASREYWLATQASRWGADQELEACCEWLRHDLDAYELVGLRAVYLDHNLRAARRPKPPSLKEQALQALDLLKVDASTHGLGFDSSTIRRALESLSDV